MAEASVSMMLRPLPPIPTRSPLPLRTHLPTRPPLPHLRDHRLQPKPDARCISRSGYVASVHCAHYVAISLDARCALEARCASCALEAHYVASFTAVGKHRS